LSDELFTIKCSRLRYYKVTSVSVISCLSILMCKLIDHLALGDILFVVYYKIHCTFLDNSSIFYTLRRTRVHCPWPDPTNWWWRQKLNSQNTHPPCC